MHIKIIKPNKIKKKKIGLLSFVPLIKIINGFNIIKIRPNIEEKKNFG